VPQGNQAVSLCPAKSRCQLKGYRFKQRGDRRWFLSLPVYYASLFEACCATLMQTAKKGFEPAPGTSDRVAVFEELDEHAIMTVTSFLEHYGKAVCLGVNRYLSGEFADELEFCVALDFNKRGPQDRRTEIGEWEYRAKYGQDKDAATKLLKPLRTGLHWLPWARLAQPRLITYVPCEAKRKVYLARDLAIALVQQSRRRAWGVADPLLGAELKGPKPSAKNLTVSQKRAQWRDLLAAGGIALGRSVKGCSVIILDDLYQSGTSLWSFAKYLKGHGAAHVVGLVCVKSLRDSDNQ
jgi:predicted amidophosphoribosyltransferase